MAVELKNLSRLASNLDISQGDLMSGKARAIVELICYSIIGNIVCPFGIVSNIINMIVFVKLGFSHTVNISLLAMAVSDFGSLVVLQWIHVIKNPLFVQSHHWVTDEVQHMTGAPPHAVLCRITSWITAYVTFERCLCVLVPLKVKQIITGRVTVTTMATIYVLMLISPLELYVSSYLGWKFVGERNMTMYGLIVREDKSASTYLTFLVTVIVQLVSFFFVIIFTIILVILMKRSSKWRQTVASGGEDKGRKDQKRDDKTVKMIVLIAVIYAVCYTPSIIVYLTSLHVPELNPWGKYRETFFAGCAVNFMLEGVNSSVNIIVYYAVSTKYRMMFDKMFGRAKLAK